MRYSWTAVVLLLVALGCARQETMGDTASAPDSAMMAANAKAERARAAASIANAMAANPAAADSILTAGGHTRESFEALMYEIAADSVMSAAYAAAKNP